jgi:two-component system, NtrC family, sensor kinase
MEETAGRIVQYLYLQFSGGDARKEPFALVRLFKTHRYSSLEPDLQNSACRLLGREPEGSMKCLTLIATVGTKPEWCSRRLSAGHQAIPLASQEGVARIPMIANLVYQFGLESSHVIEPDPTMLTDLSQRTFNVFHVPEAVGSANVPAQKEFVIAESIQSCLGFGGILPHGDLFAVIMFSRVPISSATASLFKSLSLGVKIALLPFESKVFA